MPGSDKKIRVEPTWKNVVLVIMAIILGIAAILGVLCCMVKVEKTIRQKLRGIGMKRSKNDQSRPKSKGEDISLNQNETEHKVKQKIVT